MDNDALMEKDALYLLSFASTIKRLNGCIPTHIAEGQGWIHFKTEKGTEYSCRTFFGDTFPDVSKYMDVQGEDFELPKSIEEVIRPCVYLFQ